MAINCPEPDGYLGGRMGTFIQMQLLRYREKPVFTRIFFWFSRDRAKAKISIRPPPFGERWDLQGFIVDLPSISTWRGVIVARDRFCAGYGNPRAVAVIDLYVIH